MRWVPLLALALPLLTGGCATYLNYADAKIAAYEAEQRAQASGQTAPTAPQPKTEPPVGPKPGAVTVAQAAPAPSKKPPAKGPYAAPYGAPQPFPRALARAAMGDPVARPFKKAPAPQPSWAPAPSTPPILAENKTPPAPIKEAPTTLAFAAPDPVAPRQPTPVPVAAPLAIANPAPAPILPKALTGTVTTAVTQAPPQPAAPVDTIILPCRQAVDEAKASMNDVRGEIGRTAKTFARKADDDLSLTPSDQTALALSEFAFDALKDRMADITPKTVKKMTSVCTQLSECSRSSCSVDEAERRSRLMDAWRQEVRGLVDAQRVHLKATGRLLNKEGFDPESAQAIGLQMSERLSDLEALLTAPEDTR